MIVEELLGISSTLSRRALNLLRRISKSDETEMVWAKPGGWWVDCDQVAGRDAFELIRAAAITNPSGDPVGDTYQRWEITGRGNDFLLEAAKAAGGET